LPAPAPVASAAMAPAPALPPPTRAPQPAPRFGPGLPAPTPLGPPPATVHQAPRPAPEPAAPPRLAPPRAPAPLGAELGRFQDPPALVDLVNEDRLPGQPACTRQGLDRAMRGESSVDSGWWSALADVRVVAARRGGVLLGAASYAIAPTDK